MPRETPWHEQITTPALLRHARTTYGAAMRHALANAGYDDIPKNGLYLIGGMAFHAGNMPLGKLVKDLRISKQAAGQLVDTLVMRGYLQSATDEQDRRRLIVTLTGRGQAAAEVQTNARKEIDAELLARVGGNGVNITRKTLAALVDIGRQRERGNDDA